LGELGAIGRARVTGRGAESGELSTGQRSWDGGARGEGGRNEGEGEGEGSECKKGQQAVQCHLDLGGLEAMGGGCNEAGGIIVQ